MADEVQPGPAWAEAFDSIESLKSCGFVGFLTAVDLAASRGTEVPVTRGVYVIAREPAAPPSLMPRSVAGHYRGQDPSVDPEALAERWVADAVVLYIGEAGGTGVRGQLQQRIKRQIRFGGGAAIAGGGGRAIWQLRDHRALRFGWLACEEAGEMSAKLLGAFQGRYGVRPFANDPEEAEEE